jgi:hypothetical protein
MKIHLFVISWTGKREAAEAIVASASHADFRTVIYSNATESLEEGTGEWLSVPNAWFFGRKFERALDAFHPEADIFLLVQADAVLDDWNRVIDRCREAFRDETVGVWAPHVHHSWWTNERVVMGEGSVGSVVAQTDGIAWAFRRSTVERLRSMDYACNNLGWGVEWAAIVHAHTEGRRAYRDQTISVFHPTGSGYNHGDARAQMNAYLSQLTASEKAYFHWLVSFTVRPLGAPLGPS